MKQTWGVARRAIRGSLAALVLTQTALAAPLKYNPDDYRRGEIVHVWPKHGVWEVMLRAGGSDGSDTCLLATEAGAKEPTFFLTFNDDGSPGGELTVGWADTNSAPNYGADRYAMVVDHTGLRVVPPAPPNAPASEQGHNADLLGSWQIIRVPRTGSVGRIGGLRFYIETGQLVAWNTPNRDAKSPFSRLRKIPLTYPQRHDSWQV